MRPAVRPVPVVSAALLAEAEVVVIGAGPHPGPDAVAVAREVASRLDSARPGRVVLLAQSADLDAAARISLPVPLHWVGGLLRSWAERGLEWPAAQEELRVVRQRLDGTSGAGALRDSGAVLVAGRVTLLPKGRVAFDTLGPNGETHVLSPQRIVLAPGSRHALPDVAGIGETTVHTADTLLDLAELPGSVVVLGAGSHGCELAQGLARLGVTVTVVEAEERLLPRLPVGAAEPVTRALAADGVRMICGARVVKVAPTLDGGAWIGTDRGGDVAAEAFVLASGRRPRSSGLDLATAGIAVGPTGAIGIDDQMRTVVPTVLACGEVTGMQVYGAAPGPMARMVAANVVARRPGLRWSAPVAARVTRTDPEVVVLGEVDALPEGASEGTGDGPTEGTSVRVVVGPAGGRGLLGRSILGGHPARGLLGAVLVGPGASEAAGQLVLALNAGLPAAALIDIVAPDGTWAAAIQTATARALALA
jgi:pyruvate/2-oxoglutarate dehydrogenase complex dihydrolipoamide dehydrogenase (E3) component